jgi:hypothetical protein
MITEAKLKEYIWCRGDIDGYIRSGRVEKNIITDEDWKFIDEMITKIRLIRTGLAAKKFVENHEKEKRKFDSVQTYKLLQNFEQKC